MQEDQADTRLRHNRRERPDSNISDSLIDETDSKGEDVWLDAGYVGRDEAFKEKEANPIICEKGYRGHPLTDEQKASNREKSKIRSRVEHVFGFIEGSMGGMVFRAVGMVRARACVALTNLTYNIARFMQISKYHPQWITMSYWKNTLSYNPVYQYITLPKKVAYEVLTCQK